MTTPGRNGSFRRVVLVSGPPGSGKSTLAGPLADLLASGGPRAVLAAWRAR
ncbi:MAG: hypothetical protein ACYCPF_16835 [Streptosporangiaceae bacterium]